MKYRDASYLQKIERAMLKHAGQEGDEEQALKLTDVLEACKSHIISFNRYFSLYSMTSAIGRRLACFMANEMSKKLVGEDECQMAAEAIKGFQYENKRLYTGSNKNAANWLSASEFRRNKQTRYKPYGGQGASRYFPRSQGESFFAGTSQFVRFSATLIRIAFAKFLPWEVPVRW